VRYFQHLVGSHRLDKLGGRTPKFRGETWEKWTVLVNVTPRSKLPDSLPLTWKLSLPKFSDRSWGSRGEVVGILSSLLRWQTSKAQFFDTLAATETLWSSSLCRYCFFFFANSSKLENGYKFTGNLFLGRPEVILGSEQISNQWERSAPHCRPNMSALFLFSCLSL
jgi:hypothetical protein